MNRLLISLLVTSAIVIGICSASPVPVREKLWNSDEDILTQNRVNLRRRRQYDVDGG
uniref:Uncharacterized protein n=1 Tax=Plectus sambesii TaxID=2011161 RepID=A0A914X927_9BILA